MNAFKFRDSIWTASKTLYTWSVWDFNFKRLTRQTRGFHVSNNRFLGNFKHSTLERDPLREKREQVSTLSALLSLAEKGARDLLVSARFSFLKANESSCCERETNENLTNRLSQALKKKHAACPWASVLSLTIFSVSTTDLPHYLK